MDPHPKPLTTSASSFRPVPEVLAFVLPQDSITLYAPDVLKTSQKTSPVVPAGRITTIADAPEPTNLLGICARDVLRDVSDGEDILQDILEIRDISA